MIQDQQHDSAGYSICDNQSLSETTTQDQPTSTFPERAEDLQPTFENTENSPLMKINIHPDSLPITQEELFEMINNGPSQCWSTNV